MAGSVNKVILIGNLGGDPDVRSFPSGDKYCRLSVATNESWRDRETGEQKEKTEWHNITVYNTSTAQFVEQYLRKGSKVFIEGQLETRKWQDQSGQDKYATDVVIRGFRGNLQTLDRQSDGDWPDSGDYDRSGRSDTDNRGAQRGSMEQSAVDMSDLDDNIPF